MAEGTCCYVPDVANAAITGTTPIGPIAVSWAWYATTGGECGGLWDLYVYGEPAQIGSLEGPYLTIDIDEKEWQGGLQGVGPAFFGYFYDGAWEGYTGEVTVISVDEPHRPYWCLPGDPIVTTDARFEIAFAIEGEGWDVDGQLSAVYCPQLNVFCP